ncbi:MAG TPA: hypothetical protein PLY40_07610 [Bacillota bacterium]|nr:hypothetical protein [Bacillota bacterium]
MIKQVEAVGKSLVDAEHYGTECPAVESRGALFGRDGYRAAGLEADLPPAVGAISGGGINPALFVAPFCCP